MYLPKRLELSLRNVLALPKAWRRRRKRKHDVLMKHSAKPAVPVVSATVAQITGHAQRSHTCAHLEDIWPGHIKNKVVLHFTSPRGEV